MKEWSSFSERWRATILPTVPPSLVVSDEAAAPPRGDEPLTSGELDRAGRGEFFAGICCETARPSGHKLEL